MAPISFIIGPMTTGVTAVQLPPGFSVSRTGVGSYRLRCPRGNTDGIYLHVDSNGEAVFYASYGPNGSIDIYRDYDPADPGTDSEKVDGVIFYRGVYQP